MATLSGSQGWWSSPTPRPMPPTPITRSRLVPLGWGLRTLVHALVAVVVGLLFGAAPPNYAYDASVMSAGYTYDADVVVQPSRTASDVRGPPADGALHGDAGAVGPSASKPMYTYDSGPNCTAANNVPRFITTGRGVTIDRLSVNATVSAQRQGRHVLGAREYGGGSYFNSADDAQAVLDGFHSGAAEVLGVKGNDIVVRMPGVTGFNHNPGAGFPNQATDVFFIKGTSSPSVVPYNPAWTP